jgi:lipopolysaccharide export system permease protein
MKVLNKYLLKEVLSGFFAVLIVLFLVLVANMVSRMLAEEGMAGMDMGPLLQIVLLKMPRDLVTLLPFSLFIAVLLAYSRLYSESEMYALSACGIGPGMLLRHALWYAFPVALLVAVMVSFVSPWSYEQVYQLEENFQEKSIIQRLSAGKFQETDSTNGIIYIQSIDDSAQHMEHVFVHTESPHEVTTVVAVKGEQRRKIEDGQDYMVLSQGQRYSELSKESLMRVTDFEEYGVQLPAQKAVSVYRQRKSFPMSRLWNSSDPHDVAELQWRLAAPFGPILLAMLGVLMAKVKPRQGKYSQLIPAMLIYLTYYNLLAVSRSWLEQSVVPVWVGLWWVNFALIVLLLGLLFKQMGFRWMLFGRFGLGR